MYDQTHSNSNQDINTFLPEQKPFSRFKIRKNGEWDIPVIYCRPFRINSLKNITDQSEPLNPASKKTTETTLHQQQEKLDQQLKEAGINDLKNVCVWDVDGELVEEIKIIGDMCVTLGQYKDAIKYFDAYALAVPKDDVVWRCSGFLHWKINEINVGINCFKNSVRENPEGEISMKAYLNLKALQDFTESDLKRDNVAEAIGMEYLELPLLTRKELGNRIRDKVLGVPRKRTGKDVAIVLGFDREATVSAIFNGKALLSEKMVTDLERLYKVNLRWEYVLQFNTKYESFSKTTNPAPEPIQV